MNVNNYRTDVPYANRKSKVCVGKTLVCISSMDEKAQTNFKKCEVKLC